MNRVYIILVNWNGWHDTIECLESLISLEYPDFRIVVCDNGSSDDSLQQLRNWTDCRHIEYAEYQRCEADTGGCVVADPKLTLIVNGENLGFSGGNNVGLRYAMARNDADYYWLLNNDTVVEPDALTHLVERMQQQTQVGICGSTIKLYHDRRRIQALGGGHYCSWLGLPWHFGRFSKCSGNIEQSLAEARMNYVEGASMLVNREFVEEIGLLCEDYFLYFEEADWAIRAKGRFKLAYASKSTVYHKVGSSIGTSSNPKDKSYICDYFSVRNRIVFTKRYYPAALPTVYIVLVVELLIRIFLGKIDRVMMIVRLMFGNSDVHLDASYYKLKP